MKLLLAPVAALLALAATPVTAQSLAPGEIELRIEALGQIPADTATVPVQIVGRGKDEAAAKAALAKKEKEVRASLAKLGIAPAKIVTVKDDEPQYAVTTEAAVPYDCAADAAPPMESSETAMSPPPPMMTTTGPRTSCDPEVTKNRTLMVTVDDLKKLPAIAKLSEQEYYVRTNGTYFHRDPAAAHTAAIAEAIAKARADAEVYAAALGMRVVRMIRVGNTKAKINWPDLFNLFGGFASKIDIPDGEDGAVYQLRAFAAADFAGVTIDFVLAPK